MARDDSWDPPQEFDEYRLVRLLGKGTMGQVYLAHDRVLDRPVAIKFVTTLESDARERFRQVTLDVLGRALSAGGSKHSRLTAKERAHA